MKRLVLALAAMLTLLPTVTLAAQADVDYFNQFLARESNPGRASE